MTKSYISKATINFIDYNFYVRPGDLLVHNPANQNRLTVYRNGQIVKVAKQEPIGIAAFLKNNFIEEVVSPGVTVETVDVSVVTPAPEVPSCMIVGESQDIPEPEMLITDNLDVYDAYDEPKALMSPIDCGEIVRVLKPKRVKVPDKEEVEYPVAPPPDEPRD